MEKVFTLGMKQKEKEELSKICSNVGIKVIEIANEHYNQKISDLIAGTVQDKEISTSTVPKESLILFDSLSDKHLDHVLAKLRLENISSDYKAIVTETNKTWSLSRLCAEMELEKKEMMKLKK